MSVQVETRTYTSPEVCRLAGISYRQLDYWERCGLIRSSVRAVTLGSLVAQGG